MAACPIVWDENSVCRTCAELYDMAPLWDGEKCVSVCQNGQFTNLDDKTCVASCASGLYMFVGTVKICVNMCGLDQFVEMPEKDGMSECAGGCGTRAFVEVDSGNGTYKKCVDDDDDCGRYVKYTDVPEGWLKNC